ncbi:hypothetical protein [Christiangramia forsetii]|uniref:Lin1244/Lin1753-like N-terminal domain-containing protein n=2 Tax=Christiangramia forsetii TaxID=411153 RepID=A0M484_CHRFK|nr:hypothetical protein [Christiangramia forsetii]GGG24011.1 hypothetical protein GCM10011532_04050 [Christiangramia forsetii]CAL67429.1 hypothetical protein GFO_2473 [Christiangramia forsetii KT0803]
MARRFIDTGFFKDPFVRGLQGAYKGLYVYLFLDCSSAGIWNVELDVAKLRCGIDQSVTDEQIKEVFEDKIVELEDGQKWFIKNYLKVQHNGLLKRNNKAHTSAIEELIKYDLIEEISEGEFQLSEKIIKGLPRGLQDPKVMVKVKEQGNGKGKSNGKEEKTKIIKKSKEEESEIVFPFDSNNFKTQWNHWKIYKKKEFKFDYKSLQSEQAALTELANKSDGNEKKAIAIMHQSMSNGWKGIFELKTEKNVNNRNSESNTEIAKRAMGSKTAKDFRFK